MQRELKDLALIDTAIDALNRFETQQLKDVFGDRLELKTSLRLMLQDEIKDLTVCKMALERELGVK